MYTHTHLPTQMFDVRNYEFCHTIIFSSPNKIKRKDNVTRCALEITTEKYRYYSLPGFAFSGFERENISSFELIIY